MNVQICIAVAKGFRVTETAEIESNPHHSRLLIQVFMQQILLSVARFMSADDITEKAVTETNCCAIIDICPARLMACTLTWTKA